MKPVFVTAESTLFSLAALSKPAGAGSPDAAPVPPEFRKRIHAAWRASTEWIDSAATTIARVLRFGPWPAYAETPVSSRTCAVFANVAGSVTAAPKSNVGDLTA